MLPAILLTLLQIHFAAPAGIDCGPSSFTATAEGVEAVRGAWGPGTAVDLDGSRTWRVEVVSERCWSPPLTVTTQTTIPVWPKRTVRGRMLVPGGARMPASVEMRIASPPRATAPEVPESVVRCPVSGGRFTCEVPAVPLDVRVSAGGFAPHYLWDVTAGDLGEIRFITGASVSGWASAGDSHTGIDIELRPASSAWSSKDLARIAAQARRAKTNARGFFAFSDVPPGEYVAAAKKEGWSAAQYRVHVAGGATEAVVGQDLVLPELGRLDVVITPPADALQRPWKVRLRRRVESDRIPVAEGEAENGHWSRGGLDAGRYEIDVIDGSGNIAAAEGRVVTGGPMAVPIQIEQVMVRGRVTLGGEPVPAQVRFNDGYGKIVSLATDDEGRLSGILPKEGEWWQVDVRPKGRRNWITLRDVEVRRSQSTGYADLELELPAGRVRGVVVDPEGQPVQANVSVWRGRESVAGAPTATDGTFEIIGLIPGEVAVLAKGQNQQSELISHRIRDGEDDPLRIIVRQRRPFRGRLLTSDGRPVAGAQVHHRTPAGAWVELTSGPGGEFTIPAAPADSHIHLAIVAHGLPFKFASMPLGAGSEKVDIVFAPVPGLLSVAWDALPATPLILGNGGLLYNIGLMASHPAEPESKPARYVPDGFQVLLEPGEYRICSRDQLTCETVQISAGGRASVDAKEWQ